MNESTGQWDAEDVLIDEAFTDLREAVNQTFRFLGTELEPLVEARNDVAGLDLSRHLELVEAVSRRLRQAGVPAMSDPDAPARRLLEILYQALRGEW